MNNLLNKTKKIMVVAGGSGGHVFPGLAVAHYLMDQGYQILWVGTADHIESKLVVTYGIDIKFIRMISWRGRTLHMKFITLLLSCMAIYQIRRIIKYWKPDVVLGMGGYVSGPGGIAAWLCGVPLIIHEQNSVIGLTNRCLSIFAKRILLGYSSVVSPNQIVAGNPIRHTILSIPDPTIRWKGRTGPIRVLVMGGSSGACIFNTVLPKVAKQLPGKLIIWHQSGEQDFNKVVFSYQKIAQNHHKVMKFIDNIAQAYAWADILISRSGALTVSEVSVVGLAAIFVPFMYHKDQQQYWNAVPLMKVGAIKIIEEKEFTNNYVSMILNTWNRTMLCNMAQKARSIGIPNATRRVAQIIIEYLN